MYFSWITGKPPSPKSPPNKAKSDVLKYTTCGCTKLTLP